MGLIQAISIAAYDLTRGVNTVGCGVVSRLGEWIGYREESKRHGSPSEVRVALQFR